MAKFFHSPGKLPPFTAATGQAAPLHCHNRASCTPAAAPGKLPSRSRAGQAAPPSLPTATQLVPSRWQLGQPPCPSVATWQSATGVGISRSPVHYPALVTWLVAANRPLQGAAIELVRRPGLPNGKIAHWGILHPPPSCPGVVSKLPLCVITEIQHTMCNGRPG